MRAKGIGGMHAMEDEPESKRRKRKIKVSAGIGPATGKHAQRATAPHGSCTEAAQAREGLKRKLLGTGHAESRKTTLSRCRGPRLDTADPPHRLPENARCSRRCAVKAVCRCIGALPVPQIAGKHVAGMVEGRIGGKTLGGRRCSGNAVDVRCSAPSGMTTRFAAPEGHASRSPSAGCPSAKEDQREANAASVEQLERLACGAHDRQGPRCTALLLALLAGCRASEALAVRWKGAQGGLATVKGTKGKAASATPPTMDAPADMPAMRRVTQASGMKAPQPTQTPGTHVPTDLAYGREPCPTPNRAWRRLGSGLGLDGPRPHGLRHRLVSCLCMGGMSVKAARQTARHSGTAATMGMHARARERDSAAGTAEAQRFGADSPQALPSADGIRGVFSV